MSISRNNAAYWRKKSKDNIAFSKSTLTTSLKHLIQNYYFMVGNSILRQKIGIPMGIDPVPFWANLFLYTYENKYMSELISNDKVKVCHFQTTKHFMGVFSEGVFNLVYKAIYPLELQMKVEHSGTHATFLNLGITVKDGVSVYKLFDKHYAFPFFIVRIPYIDINIPKLIFYSTLLGEFLRLACSSFLYKDFREKVMKLLNRMKTQGAISLMCRKALISSSVLHKMKLKEIIITINKIQICKILPNIFRNLLFPHQCCM